MDMDADERFWRKVEITGFCWNWTAAAPRGYGDFWFDGKVVRAHRWAYERLVGPLGDYDGDHLCRNTLCVNPDHLDPVSHGENISRRHRLVTNGSCSAGHPWTPETLRVETNGQWRCRTCRAEYQRAKRARERV